MGNSAAVTTKLDYKSTSQDVMKIHGIHAKGKHCIITGANVGLGFETAKSLLEQGAIVSIACRSKTLGDEAVAKLKEAIPGADVTLLQLDLGSFKSVRAAAATYKASGKPLHARSTMQE